MLVSGERSDSLSNRLLLLLSVVIAVAVGTHKIKSITLARHYLAILYHFDDKSTIY